MQSTNIKSLELLVKSDCVFSNFMIFISDCNFMASHLLFRRFTFRALEQKLELFTCIRSEPNRWITIFQNFEQSKWFFFNLVNRNYFVMGFLTCLHIAGKGKMPSSHFLSSNVKTQLHRDLGMSLGMSENQNNALPVNFSALK